MYQICARLGITLLLAIKPNCKFSAGFGRKKKLRSSIQIFLVADNGLLCQGLRTILQQVDDLLVIGEASSGEALFDQMQKGTCPDVVLIDVYLEEMSGIEVTAHLKSINPAVYVIGLSAASEPVRLAMLQAGASFCLNKTSRASELVKAIQRACADQLELPFAQASGPGSILALYAMATQQPPAAGLVASTKSYFIALKLLSQAFTKCRIADHLITNEGRVKLPLKGIFAATRVTDRMDAGLETTCIEHRLPHSEPSWPVSPEIELNENYQVTIRGHLVDLTPTEYQLLYLLMSVAGQPISKKDLLHYIWHSNFERSTNLVEVTIRRLREKIEANPSRPLHVVTVRRVGYKFNPNRKIH